MAVKYFRYDDSGAPILDGLASSLINVLDACLVNGYGSKEAAGWTKSFSGTNKAVYRANIGNRFYYRILDDNVYSDTIDFSSASFARIQGYESMSDVDTGVNPFPSYNIASNIGLYLTKTDTRTSTTKPWAIIADERFCIFISGFNIYNNCVMICFGEFYSYVKNDLYNSMICASGSPARGYSPTCYNFAIGTAAQTNIPIVRRFDGLSTSIGSYKSNMNGFGVINKYSGQQQSFIYPNPVTNGIILSPQIIIENSIAHLVRGRLPGLWFACQNFTTSAFGEVIQGGTGTDLEGKTFAVFSQFNNSGGGMFFEISDTWYDGF